MRNKKKNRILLLLVLLLGISIGFAALATTLKINGTANIGKNTWDVHWANVGDIQKSSTTTITTGATVDSNDNTKVNFEVTLNQPGDYYEFQVDAVNAGTIDAMANIVSKTTVPSYASLTVKYADGEEINKYDLLAKAPDPTAEPPVYTTERVKVRIEFKRDIDEDDLEEIGDGENIDIVVDVPYDQADDNAKDRHALTPEDFATDSWETIASVGALDDPTTGPYRVGDTKTIEMDLDGDNTPETYTLRIANLSKPNECKENDFSQTACGLVVEFVDIISTRVMNPNSLWTNGSYGIGTIGGWEYSDMRAYLNSGKHSEIGVEKTDYTNTGLLSKLPEDLRDNIVTTKVISGRGYNDSENYETNDKIYLLSEHEVIEYLDISERNHGYNLEYYDNSYANTRQLDYYDGQGVKYRGSANTMQNEEKMQKNYNGSVYPWWFRTAYKQSSVEYVAQIPTYYFRNYICTTPFGVSPAFRLG
jgi:hypothetical protein